MRDKGTVMASTRPEGWGEVLSMIDREDVYAGEGGTYGLETDPHVTVIHGLEPEVHEDLVCRVCQGIDSSLEVRVKGSSVFSKDEYDVLKFDVASPLLRKMNKAFRAFPYENDYDTYKPHMTAAYLKKGRAKKYLDKIEKPMPDSIEFPKFKYTPGGEEESMDFPII